MTSEPRERLEGWKQIAAYLQRDVRTVQRRERSEQFPVRRQLHQKLSSVLALKKDVDRWMDQRCSLHRDKLRVSLAVRYFDNPTGSQKDAYFRDAVVEDLITSLSKVKGLRVFPRSTMGSFRNTTSIAVSIGKRLGASRVLEGTMRRTRGRVLLSVQLVETRSGHAVWAERYDSDAKEILPIQDDLRKMLPGLYDSSLSGPTERVDREARAFPQPTCMHMTCISEAGSSFISSGAGISKGRENCLHAVSKWILSLLQPTQGSPTAAPICIFIGKPRRKICEPRIQPAARPWSWLQNSLRRTLPVAWHSQPYEIIRKQRRNFGLRLASMLASMRLTISTDAPVWRKEGTKNRSSRCRRQQACARKTIRLFHSLEWLTRG
jgi:TolB-like protein